MRLREVADVFRRVGRNRGLRRLGFSFAGFQAAEFGVWIATLVYAYDRGGTSTAALVAVVQTLPAGLFAPIGGALADRYAAGRVLAWGYAAQAAAMGLVAAALLADGPPALVYALSALPATAFAVTRPAQAVLLPALSRSPDELTAANVVMGWIETAMSLLGPLLAGAVLTVGTPGAVYAVFAAVVALSTLLTIGLAAEGRVLVDGRGGIVAEIVAGFRALAASPGPRLLMILLAAGYIGWGALDVLIVVLALDVLGLADGGPGYLFSVFGLGGFLGIVAAVGLVGRRRLTPAIVVAAFVWGIAFAPLGVSGSTAIAVLLLGVAGAGAVLFDVAGRTLLQRISPPDVVARIFGIHEGVTLAMFAVGAAIVPPLVSAGGAGLAFAVTGAILPLAVLLLLFRLLAIDREALVPIVEISLLRSMPIFEHLRPPVLEGLAHRLESQEAAAGTVIIRQGDHGDAYYVIADGEVEIDVDGAPVARHGRADGFGEIALLQDTPRTATVTALTHCRLYRLEGDAFVMAVTRHAPAAGAAEAIARERSGVRAPRSAVRVAMPPAPRARVRPGP